MAKGLLESSFARFFEAAPVGMLVHDGNAIVACNPTAAALLGGQPSDFMGRSVVDLTPAPERERIRQRIAAGLEGQFEGKALRQDGKTQDVRMMVRQVVVDGRPLRIVVVEPSVAPESLDTIRAEILKEEEVLRLQQTNQFKTQLLNTAAHELNTPLTPLRLQLHMLKSGALGDLTDRQAKAVGVLDRNVQRLSSLVSDVLDVARLESHQLEVKTAPVPMVEVIGDALEAYSETARQVGVRLTHEGDERLVVEGDPQRLVQVLYNLVGNALKFTPEGGSVVIRTTRRGQAARIEIQDTGMGMAPEQIDRLFQPFSRVHDTQRSAIAGTGLGLYICRGIVEAHGGTIGAASDGPGKGSTFYFEVPLAADQTARGRPHDRADKPVDALAQRLRELI